MADTVEITDGPVTMRLHGPCLANPIPDVRAALQRIAAAVLAIAGPQAPDGRIRLADTIRGIHAPGIDDWDDEHRPTHASCTACAEPRWTDPEDNEDPNDVPLMWRTWPCPTIRALGHPWTSPHWRPHNAPQHPAPAWLIGDTGDAASGAQRGADDVVPCPTPEDIVRSALADWIRQLSADMIGITAHDIEHAVQDITTRLAVQQGASAEPPSGWVLDLVQHADACCCDTTARDRVLGNTPSAIRRLALHSDDQGGDGDPA